MKAKLIIRKNTSNKSGANYLSGAIKIGDYGKYDYFFPSATNVLALTGMSMQELQESPVGVLYQKEFEV